MFFFLKFFFQILVSLFFVLFYSFILVFIFFHFILFSQFSSCEEAFQHPMDHVHIAIVLITMLEIVLVPDNFLIILMSICTLFSRPAKNLYSD
jgi:hypothetical protein